MTKPPQLIQLIIRLNLKSDVDKRWSIRAHKSVVQKFFQTNDGRNESETEVDNREQLWVILCSLDHTERFILSKGSRRLNGNVLADAYKNVTVTLVFTSINVHYWSDLDGITITLCYLN